VASIVLATHLGRQETCELWFMIVVRSEVEEVSVGGPVEIEEGGLVESEIDGLVRK
jgi:hypothetical protein